MAELKYLLDTSTCIELLRGNEHVRQLCVEHNQLCCISAITAIELLYGAYNAPVRYRQQELAKARLLIDYYDIVGIDDIADAFSREKVRLESIGQPIEDFDLLIGITARENDLAVVTHNTKHFSRIEGLKTEDWLL
ncbi:MAG: PIN domain-containing protein [Prevotella sp.]|nr:PIN domain-containing protein [Prevotella sp.]MBQ8486694.1 PIN domain-containing protein [Prevotella sp.]